MAARWLHRALAEDAGGRAAGGLGDHDPEHLSDFLGQVREALAVPVNWNFARPWVKEVLEQEGRAIPEGTEAYRKLTLAVLQSLATYAGIARDRSQGVWNDTAVPAPPPAPPKYTFTAAKRSAAEPQGEGGKRLSEVLEAWLIERQPSSKTEKEWRTAFRRLREFVGEDAPITAVRKEHIWEFKDALLQCPVGLRRSIRKRTLPEIVELTNGDQDVARLSPAAVNKQLGAVSAVFAWAVQNGYMETNVAAGMKVRDRERARDKRLSFSPADLKVIFSQDREDCRKTDPELYWLPLLALYTGARLEELGQALVSDIGEDKGITYLDINATEDGKRLKTAGSKRKVPLHPELIRRGFLEYVGERRDAGDARLFPRLRPDTLGTLTGHFSKRFARHLRLRLGITDRRKTFHSFRHTFKDACRAAGVPQEVHDALTGHAGEGVGRTYGSEGGPLAVKAAALERVSYDSLPQVRRR